MYEFSHISAANASLESIQEERQRILSQLGAALGEYNPDLKKKKKKKLEDAKDLDPYEMDRMQEYIDLYNYVKNGFNVVIEVDKLKNEEIKLVHIKKLIKKAQQLNLPLNVFVTGYSQFGKEKEHVEMLFSKNILGTFVALNSYLKVNGCSAIKFMEDPMRPENSWTLDDVLKANKEIDSIVETIKLQKFSPLEAMVYIHYYITSQFPYQEDVENPIKPRSIIGLLTTDKIVCVGYAELTKAIIDKLNMENNQLTAETIDTVIKPIYPKDKIRTVNKLTISGFAHAQNVITIKDDKYMVNGTYVSDACWDTKSAGFEVGKGFGNFMYTVNDVHHYAGFTYQEVESRSRLDMTKILESEEIMQPDDMPLNKKHGKKSKQIPAAVIDEVIYKVLKKIYPFLNEKDLKGTAAYYSAASRVVAASIFNEEADSEYAREGRIALEKLKDKKNVSVEEIMK